MRFKFAAALAAGTIAAVGLLPVSAYASGNGAFVGPLHTFDTVASTVPKTGTSTRTARTVNGGDGNLVETTPQGMQIAVRQLDDSVTPGSPPGAGALFGLAVVPGVRAVYFVDDASNQLNILH